MPGVPRGFRLVLDPRLSAGGISAAGPVEVGQAPLLVAASGGEALRPSRLAVALPPSAVIVEPVRIGRAAKLLMVATGAWCDRLCVNGAPSPCVTLLGVGDEVRLGDRFHLHVTIYERPDVAPAHDVHAGNECPVCRGRIEWDDVVYSCPGCGVAMHCEPDDAAPGASEDGEGDEALPCAHLASECSCCGAPVILDEGYVHAPQV